MLEHKLKNLNVYRDSKPKLDSIQMPYSKREKRVSIYCIHPQYYCQVEVKYVVIAFVS